MINHYITKLNKLDNKKYLPVTADFETYIERGVHKLLVFSIFSKLFQHTASINSVHKLYAHKTLAENFIKQLLKLSLLQGKPFIVYMHNLSNFDGIILLGELKKLNIFKHLQLIIKNNSVFQIKFKSVIIRDSYKLLDLSLNKLSWEIFNKPKISRLFYNKSFLKNFIKKKFYKKKIHRRIYISPFPLFAEYCLKDSKCLFKILLKFEKLLYKKYKFSIVNSLTISSLALRIFRTYYLTNENIFNSNLFDEDVYRVIKDSYSGGIVDVYKPWGENLFHFDINSSYPFAMLNYMPVGEPIKIKPSRFNFTKDFESFFGFLTVKIKVKETYIPFLGTHDSTLGGNIYPWGEFILSVFSEELRYALKVNQIEILKVYKVIKFQKCKLFHDFVNQLFLSKSLATNQVEVRLYKSILNYLYGRLGMKKKVEKSLWIQSHEFNYLDIISNIDVLKEYKNTLLVNIKNVSITNSDIYRLQIRDKDKLILSRLLNLLNNSRARAISAIHIASAITAYARINIDKWKREVLNKGGNLYYSDTDSLITDIYLETSDYLGGLKLENKITEGYFLAPKVYCVKIYDNDVIKFKGVSNTIFKNYSNRLLFKHICFKLLKEASFNSKFEFVTYIPIRKDFKSLSINSCHFKFTPLFNLKKRNKVSINKYWVDTAPLYSAN